MLGKPYSTNAPLPPVRTVCEGIHGNQDATRDLQIINASMAALQEIADLPEQDEFSLLRAMAHTMAINHSCQNLNAWASSQAVIAKAAA
jgi:hypothetical protein